AFSPHTRRIAWPVVRCPRPPLRRGLDVKRPSRTAGSPVCSPVSGCKALQRDSQASEGESRFYEHLRDGLQCLTMPSLHYESKGQRVDSYPARRLRRALETEARIVNGLASASATSHRLSSIPLARG